MTLKATVWVEGGWIKLRAPYDKFKTPDVNADMKSTLPRGTRRWSPDEKVWLIDPAYDEELMTVLNRHYDEVVVIEPQPAVEPPQHASSISGDPYGAMLRLASDKTLAKVYRVIAAALHPDAGGDADAFKRLGEAWAAVKADRGL